MNYARLRSSFFYVIRIVHRFYTLLTVTSLVRPDKKQICIVLCIANRVSHSISYLRILEQSNPDIDPSLKL